MAEFQLRTKPPYKQSTQTFLTKAESDLRDENLRARPNYKEQGLRNLAAAIGLQAVIDYKTAKCGLPLSNGYERRWPAEEQIAECEAFFDDPIFRYFVGDKPVREIKKLIDDAELKEILKWNHDPPIQERPDEEEGEEVSAGA